MAKPPPPKKKPNTKGAPPPATSTVGNLDKAEPGDLKPLNFKVPPEFHREFKSFAASHDMSMVELLMESFHLMKNSRG